MWAYWGTERADGGQVYSTANQMIHMVGTSVACQGNFYWSFNCFLLSQLLPVPFSAPFLGTEQFLLELTEGSLAIFVAMQFLRSPIP